MPERPLRLIYPGSSMVLPLETANNVVFERPQVNKHILDVYE